MRQNGFSLVELVCVLAVIGILLVVATIKFSEFSRKCDMESQTRMIFAELMKLRSHALFERRRRAARLTFGTFSVYSSNDTSGEPVMKRMLAHPISNANLTLHFDEHGLAEFSNASICIEDDSNGAAVDSLVVFTTRIRMGKRKSGKACSSDYIVTR